MDEHLRSKFCEQTLKADNLFFLLATLTKKLLSGPEVTSLGIERSMKLKESHL